MSSTGEKSKRDDIYNIMETLIKSDIYPYDVDITTNILQGLINDPNNDSKKI